MILFTAVELSGIYATFQTPPGGMPSGNLGRLFTVYSLQSANKELEMHQKSILCRNVTQGQNLM